MANAPSFLRKQDAQKRTSVIHWAVTARRAARGKICLTASMLKQLSTFFHGTVRTTDSISLSSTLLYVAIARAPLPHHPVFCNHLSVPLCILEPIVGQLHTPLILQTTISKFSFHSSLVLRASTAFPATIFSVAVFAFIPHVRNWVLAVLFFSPFFQTFHFSSSFKNLTPLKLIPSDYVTCPLS